MAGEIIIWKGLGRNGHEKPTFDEKHGKPYSGWHLICEKLETKISQVKA
jgi:hypothetical protein